MPVELEKKAGDFIKAQKLFESQERILLAVSGGADSMALMYVMAALKAEGIVDAQLLCAHINHQLRGRESEQDEDFVVARAGELGLPVMTKRVDVRGFADRNKLSIETAARNLRLEGLLEIAGENSCGCVATAHQKNDNAETVLQRLLRGTGFRGLGGIWPVRSFPGGIRFARPMLCITRDEIIEYLRARNLRWRVDHTNYNLTYRRNFIRHRLLPALGKQSDGCVAEQLSVLSESARRFYDLICRRAEQVWAESAQCEGGKTLLDLKRFGAEHPAVKAELVRRSLVELGSGERDLSQQHYKKVFDLAGANESGKKTGLPNGFFVWCEYEKLIFARTEKIFGSGVETAESSRVKVPGQTRFGRYLIEATVFQASKGDFEKFKSGKSSFVEWFDFERAKLPLVVRYRQAGDRFWPLGSEGEKKVGKFLTAAKVPAELRRKSLVVTDSEKIVWLWPIRISEQAKVKEQTRQILQLQMTCEARE